MVDFARMSIPDRVNFLRYTGQQRGLSPEAINQQVQQYIGGLSGDVQRQFGAWVNPGSVPPPSLPAAERVAFAAQEDSLRNAYEQSRAEIGAQRGAYAQQATRGRSDVNRWAGQARPGIATNAAGRGLLTSGIYTRNVQEMRQEQLRRLGDIRLQQSTYGAGLDRELGRALTQRDTGLSAIDVARTARQQDLAAGIRSYQ
jgi:hypothetical protein